MPYKDQRLDRKRYQIQQRIELLAIVGGECCRCGNNDWRVLEIDHVNNDGNAERASGIKHNSAAFRKAIAENPERFQCLCANCHRIKTLEDRWGGPVPEPFTPEERQSRRTEFYSSERQRARAAKRTPESYSRIGKATAQRWAHGSMKANPKDSRGRFSKD